MDIQIDRNAFYAEVETLNITEPDTGMKTGELLVAMDEISPFADATPFTVRYVLKMGMVEVWGEVNGEAMIKDYLSTMITKYGRMP